VAACLTFKCSNCGFSVDSWDDGNPYVEDPRGKRHYFHHPCEEEQIREIAGRVLGRTPKREEIDEMVKLHGGNESNFICADCLRITQRNPSKDALVCGDCHSSRLVRTHELGGTRCLSCEVGQFDGGNLAAIS